MATHSTEGTQINVVPLEIENRQVASLGQLFCLFRAAIGPIQGEGLSERKRGACQEGFFPPGEDRGVGNGRGPPPSENPDFESQEKAGQGDGDE